jgi:hypothetical protein
MNGAPESFVAQWKRNVPLAATFSSFMLLCTAFFILHNFQNKC